LWDYSERLRLSANTRLQEVPIKLGLSEWQRTRANGLLAEGVEQGSNILQYGGRGFRQTHKAERPTHRDIKPFKAIGFASLNSEMSGSERNWDPTFSASHPQASAEKICLWRPWTCPWPLTLRCERRRRDYIRRRTKPSRLQAQ